MEGEGSVRETWARMGWLARVGAGGSGDGRVCLLVVVVVAVWLSASTATATHAASVEGEERNSTAWETPWTG